jgi:ubiquinone/menaquinone biosynthesis C-methylase UbiE
MPIHQPDDFERSYKSRKWSRYKYILADCISLSSPGKILDIGCGLGFFVECAKNYGIECTGIDGSSYAITEAKSRIFDLNIAVVDLKNKIPFSENSFSTIVMNQVTEHLEDDTFKKVLLESYRLLKDGGALIIYAPSINSKEARLEHTHVNLLTPSVMEQAVKVSGFSKISHLNSRLQTKRGRLSQYLLYFLFKLWPDKYSGTTNLVAYKSKCE